MNSECKKTIEFTIKFENTNSLNILSEALGGINPRQFLWKIESDQYMSQYGMMKNNVFQLCVNEKYLALRNLIVELKENQLDKEKILSNNKSI